MVKTIEWKNNKVIMLDQSRLPIDVAYIECSDYLKVAEGIRKLWIRGAPAIGFATAIGIALAAQEIQAGDFEGFMKALQPVFNTLIATRPTAVNIQWAVERIRKFLAVRKDEPIVKLKALLIDEAQKVLTEDREINMAIGRWGAQFIHDGDTILTHCNAGSLATGGFGTATIVGSRLLYVLFNLREYLAEPLRIFKVWEGGLVFHGGLLLALPLCLMAVRRSGLPAWEVADIFAPGIAIGQAIGRLGCFAAGCCYGAPWDPPLCVTFTHPESLAPQNVALFPSQLFASGAGLVVFAALAFYRPRRRAPGQVMWLYLLLAALARLAEDAFRGREAKLALLPWLSATQAISLALAVAALALFLSFGRLGSRLTLPQ